RGHCLPNFGWQSRASPESVDRSFGNERSPGCRKRRMKGHLFSRFWVLERKGVSMEAEALEGDFLVGDCLGGDCLGGDFCGSVFFIANKRVACFLAMDTDLIFFACLEGKFD